MAERPTLEQLAAGRLEAAARRLADDPFDQIEPHCLVEVADGLTGLVFCPWGDGGQRRAILSVLRRFMREHGVRRYVFCSEAWLSTQAVGEASVEPRLHPERREGVEPGRPPVHRQRLIVRGPDGGVLALGPETDNGGAEIGGELLGLLDPAPTVAGAGHA